MEGFQNPSHRNFPLGGGVSFQKLGMEFPVPKSWEWAEPFPFPKVIFAHPCPWGEGYTPNGKFL